MSSFVLKNWDMLVRQAADIGVPEIRISGGEPLLIREIACLCSEIVVHGMEYTLHTNGSLVDRNLEWLERTPPETLWISFHPEFVGHEQFLGFVRRAALRLPQIGVNIFETDAGMEFLESVAGCGVSRVKEGLNN